MGGANTWVGWDAPRALGSPATDTTHHSRKGSPTSNPRSSPRSDPKSCLLYTSPSPRDRSLS
eukprot:6749737-Pyramimonas_sp.AAC.1